MPSTCFFCPDHTEELIVGEVQLIHPYFSAEIRTKEVIVVIMARHRYTPRKGKDDISKKEPAVMEKPTKSGMVALAATKKLDDATTSDGSLPPTLVV